MVCKYLAEHVTYQRSFLPCFFLSLLLEIGEKNGNGKKNEEEGKAKQSKVGEVKVELLTVPFRSRRRRLHLQ